MTKPDLATVYEFGPFRLDPSERLLLRNGQPLTLKPKAFDLLVFLLERPGRLIPKQELMEALWSDTFVDEANLTYTVSALRKALGDRQDGEEFIQTIPTRGYRFVAPVTQKEKRPVSSESEPPARSNRDFARRLATIVLVAALIAMVPIVVRHLRESPEAPVPERFTIPVPDTAIGTGSVPVAQISPDGKRVAFLVRPETSTDPGRIWLRSIAAAQAEPLAGTEGARALFWSPDSQQLGFTTAEAVKKFTISHARVETLCAACKPGRGGTWSGGGLILFPSEDGGLISVPASGGEPTTVTSLDRSAGEVGHVSPRFLPDGRFLYVVRNAEPSRTGLYVGQIGSAVPRLVLQGEHSAVYAAPGYLLFTRAGTIVAQSFDPERVQLKGDVTPLVEPSEYSPTPVQGGDVTVLDWFGAWPSFSVSETGVLTYAVSEHPKSQFQWMSRTGQLLELVGEPGPYMTFDLSTDGTQLVFSRRGENASLWVHDLARNIPSPLTVGPSSYSSPRWGTLTDWVMAHRPKPPYGIVKITRDGRESVIVAGLLVLDDVSQDGQYVLCRSRGTRDLVAIPLAHGGKPILVRKPPAGDIDQAQFSPDRHWIAYNADESGQHEVYVMPFPATGERWPVSQGGGIQPTWRQDSRELYYLGANGVLNAVALQSSDHPSLSVPSRLFDTGLSAPSPWVEQYAVSGDGQQFLILKPVENRVRNSIGVILNWRALLPRTASR